MRYLIKFTKEGDIKFISHLDLMRTIQRVIRRADLPAEYSKGFNPHMNMSLAQPLSVGNYSVGDYMDLVLTEEMEESKIVDILNQNTVSGVKFKSAKAIVVPEGRKIPQAMALIDAALYTITFRLQENSADINSLMDIPEWKMMKKTKSGEKETDIKPLVKNIEAATKGDRLVISALISCGSRENLSASLLSGFIKNNLQGIDKNAFVDIRREEMYALREGKLVSLENFFS